MLLRCGEGGLLLGAGFLLILCPPFVVRHPVDDLPRFGIGQRDAAVERAVAAGAKLIRPVADQFYGDRVGGIEDPFGYRWFIATHKEDLTMDEIRRRAAAQAS